MRYQITLLFDNPQQVKTIEFEADSTQTILEAALAHEVYLPNRCRVGVCTACVCKKIEGTIHYNLEPVLTEKERQQGWIFPCQAYPRSHLILSIDG